LTEIEKLIIEDVEKDRDFVRGDFFFAVHALWLTVRYFISCGSAYTMMVTGFGQFHTNYLNICRDIRKQIKKIRYEGKDRERLKELIAIRRAVIDSGGAAKAYYMKKKYRLGGKGDRNSKEYIQWRKWMDPLEELRRRKDEERMEKRWGDQPYR
jgi:hypothetical protein